MLVKIFSLAAELANVGKTFMPREGQSPCNRGGKKGKPDISIGNIRFLYF